MVYLSNVYIQRLGWKVSGVGHLINFSSGIRSYMKKPGYSEFNPHVIGNTSPIAADTPSMRFAVADFETWGDPQQVYLAALLCPWVDKEEDSFSFFFMKDLPLGETVSETHVLVEKRVLSDFLAKCTCEGVLFQKEFDCAGTPLVIYFHNFSGFDSGPLLQFLCADEASRNRIYHFEAFYIGKGDKSRLGSLKVGYVHDMTYTGNRASPIYLVEFRDSYHLLAESLDILGEAYGSGGKDTTFNPVKDMSLPVYHVKIGAALDYITQDVKILRDVLLGFQKSIVDFTRTDPLMHKTMSGAAFHVARLHRFFDSIAMRITNSETLSYAKGVDEVAENKRIRSNRFRQKISRLLRDSYYGGICEIFSFESSDGVFVYDITSSYPHKIASCSMPVGAGFWCTALDTPKILAADLETRTRAVLKHSFKLCGTKIPRVSASNIDKAQNFGVHFGRSGLLELFLSPEVFGFFDVTVTVSKCDIPPLYIHGDSSSNHDASLCAPTGEFRGTWFSEEVMEALKTGNCRITKIHSFVWYKRGVVFSSLINRVFGERKKAKLAGNSGVSFTWKIFLNSLYGRFGLRSYQRQFEVKNVSVEQIKFDIEVFGLANVTPSVSNPFMYTDEGYCSYTIYYPDGVTEEELKINLFRAENSRSSKDKIQAPSVTVDNRPRRGIPSFPKSKPIIRAVQISSAIASYGRIQELRMFYAVSQSDIPGLRLLYGDTDSVFVTRELPSDFSYLSFFDKVRGKSPERLMGQPGELGSWKFEFGSSSAYGVLMRKKCYYFVDPKQLPTSKDYKKVACSGIPKKSWSLQDVDAITAAMRSGRDFSVTYVVDMPGIVHKPSDAISGGFKRHSQPLTTKSVVLFNRKPTRFTVLTGPDREWSYPYVTESISFMDMPTFNSRKAFFFRKWFADVTARSICHWSIDQMGECTKYDSAVHKGVTDGVTSGRGLVFCVDFVDSETAAAFLVIFAEWLVCRSDYIDGDAFGKSNFYAFVRIKTFAKRRDDRHIMNLGLGLFDPWNIEDFISGLGRSMSDYVLLDMESPQYIIEFTFQKPKTAKGSAVSKRFETFFNLLVIFMSHLNVRFLKGPIDLTPAEVNDIFRGESDIPPSALAIQENKHFNVPSSSIKDDENIELKEKTEKTVRELAVEKEKREETVRELAVEKEKREETALEFAVEKEKSAREKKKYAREKEKYAREKEKYAREKEKYAREKEKSAREKEKYAREKEKYAREKKKSVRELAALKAALAKARSK